MPLLHKIIRNEEMVLGDLMHRHSLDIRHTFLLKKKQSPPLEKNKEQIAESDKKAKETDAAIRQLLSEARQEAEAIIENARKEAGEIIAGACRQATSEAEKIKADAAREGRDKGYKEGMDAAMQEAASIKKQARAVLALAEEARREMLAGLKDEVRSLALEIAEKILNRELRASADAVLDIVHECLQLVANRSYVVLWVHPRDKEICEQQRDHLLGHLPPRAELHIMASDEVEPGGCVVETDYGKVDAKLSTRWQALLAALSEGSE
ncbi:FliH/SctL family protein [Desulfallas thermosapovorans]|uniref:Flagellar assembly protein FliH n=1 Tax=Desulfallas thermosapovorans DSM 6562 TaxID=1121431 RepID=A0A5S4ZRQ4_9FIRM|nr:FliH/SctL family protein [Desulfallas thermosapovorans]TYO95485.1 flagellar assembly protein FliH [Desulfallas thermosapovorans DSM 6562]